MAENTRIGISAVMEMSNFQKGTKAYLSGIAEMSSKTTSAARSLSDQFTGLGNSVLKFGAMAGGAALVGVGALGAGLTGFAAGGISSAAEMDQALADLGALMGKTKGEIGPLKDLISQLALDPALKVSATEAAAAITVLGQNGLTMEQILGGAARSVVALSNATGSDFTTAAGISSDAMAIFGVEAAELGKVADGVSGVLVGSKFSADDYRLALAQAGAVAAGAGVSLEDFNTVLTGTASSFASGSDAGTSLKTLLMRLSSPTDEMTGLMLDLGLSLYDSTGAMRPMAEIVGQLNAAFSTMTDSQRSATAAVIGGADASRTLLALAGMTAAEFTSLSKTVNASGQASKAAAVRVDSLKGSFEILTGIIEDVQRQAGDKFLPTLRNVTAGFTDLASTAGPPVVAFFGQVAGLIDTGIAKFGELSAVFASGGTTGLLGALGIGGEGQALVGKIITDLQALGVVITASIIPAFGQLSSGILPALNSVLGFLNEHWVEVRGAIAGVLVVLGGAAVFATVAGLLTALLNPITLIIAGAALLGAAWAGNWGGIRDITAQVLAVVVPALTDLYNWLSVNLPPAIEFLGQVWDTVLKPAIDRNIAVMKFLIGVLGQVGNYVTAVIWPALEGLANVINAVLNKAVTAAAGLWQNVLWPALQVVSDYVMATLGPALEWLGGTTLPSIAGGFDGITTAIQTVTTWFNNLASNINALTLPAWLTPGSPTPFEMGLQGIASVLQGPLVAALAMFAPAAQTAFAAVQASVTALTLALQNIYLLTLPTLQTTAVTVMSAIEAAISVITGTTLPALVAMIGTTGAAFTALATTAKKAGSDMSSAMDDARDELSSLAKFVKGEVVEAFNAMRDAALEAARAASSAGSISGARTGVGFAQGIGFSRGVGLAGGLGLGWTVPPGYPNDSYPMRVQSGEQVLVTPRGLSIDQLVNQRMLTAAPGGGGMVINNYWSPNVSSPMDLAMLENTIERVMLRIA